MRHTFATNALAYGMDIKTLSTILGHVSSATTLNTYSHVTDEMRQKAAVKIDQGIAKAEVTEQEEKAKRANHDHLPGEETVEPKGKLNDADRPAGREKSPGGPVFAVCGQTCGQEALDR